MPSQESRYVKHHNKQNEGGGEEEEEETWEQKWEKETPYTADHPVDEEYASV